MKLDIETCGCYCGLKTFVINDIIADESDFVDKYDHDPESAPDYGCGDMCCDGKAPTLEVLEKYGITTAEYDEIVDRLCDVLDFGECEWCV